MVQISDMQLYIVTTLCFLAVSAALVTILIRVAMFFTLTFNQSVFSFIAFILVLYSYFFSADIVLVLQSNLAIHALFARMPIFKSPIFIAIAKVYICSVLYLRSFFVKENPDFLYILVLCLFFLRLLFPESITFFTAFFFWVYVGITLIFYDLLGSTLSSYILDNPQSALATSILTGQLKYNNILIRHVWKKVFVGMVIGKTPMTATGRAALIAGAMTGACWLVNSELDRRNIRAIEADKLVVESDKLTFEKQKLAEQLAFEREKLAFEKQKYADQTVKKSRWW